MVYMTEIACSRRIGLGQRKLGFKCGCVISGEVMANALSRHTLETADEPACSAVVFSKAEAELESSRRDWLRGEVSGCTGARRRECRHRAAFRGTSRRTWHPLASRASDRSSRAC